MNTLKTLLAVSVLTAAGAAGATTVATYDVSQTVTSVIYAGSDLLVAGSGTGTATLDDSGFLDMTITGTTQTTLTNTTTVSESHILGSYSAGTFTAATSGSTSTITSCANNGGLLNGCSSIVLNTPGSFDSVSGTVTVSGGSTNLASSQTNSGATTSATYTLTPTVPLPAAAWLFGSGIMGLAGAARRRRNAQA